jgi:TPR repeat protein
VRLVENLWFQVLVALAVTAAALTAYNQVNQSAYIAMKGTLRAQSVPPSSVVSDVAAQKPPNPNSTNALSTQGATLPSPTAASPASKTQKGDQTGSGSGQPASASVYSRGGPKVPPQSTPASSDNSSRLFDQAIQFESDRDYNQAVPLYQRSCDAGLNKACARLGTLYEKGRGVQPDMRMAVALYAKGCDRDNAQVCTGLGYQYENGINVGRDPTKALTFYEKGCDGGDATACNNLGIFYEKGLGVASDIKRAATLYVKSCDGDSAYGCNNLGLQYQKGTGIGHDLGQAAISFAKGCAGGVAQSCYNLGEAFWYGYGMKPDPAKAKEMQQKVCSMGYEWGCDRLKTMIGQN